MKFNSTCVSTGIPNVTVWRVLRKHLLLKVYKLSIVQHLKGADKAVRKEFCVQMFHRILDDARFLDSVIFSDENTFHAVVRCRTWGSGNPRVFLEHVRDSPKANVFCALSTERVPAPCSSWRLPLPSIVYLDKLQQFLISQLE
jgi:hypothetical protein